jgi:hypothetical protein
MLVPGGGIAADGETWVPAPRRKKRYLVPVHALSKKFRGRFMALARKALRDDKMPFVPAKKRWITFVKPVVQGAGQVLEYLGRYVHKTAIGNRAVVACDDRTVTFRYTDSRSHERKLMTLPVFEFLRRFLQHVPPKGFHRVRCFGLLHTRHRKTLQRLQLVLSSSRSLVQQESRDAPSDKPPKRHCPSCASSDLIITRTLDAAGCRAWSAAMAKQLDFNKPGVATARAPPRAHLSSSSRIA